MNPGKFRQIFGLLFALACSLQTAAQPENLSAQLIIKKTDAEIRKILEERSESELKEVCEAVIKQDESADVIKDFSVRVRAMQLALATARKIKYAPGEQSALFRLGAIYSQEGKIQPALEFFNQSVTTAEKNGDLLFQANALETVSLIHRNQANYDKALEGLNRALQIYEKLNNSRTSQILDSIGAIYMYLGDYNQAEASHRRALDVAEKNKSPEAIANSLFHLAIINRLRGNYADALRLYQEARQIHEALAPQNPETYPSAAIYRHISGAYFLQGNLRLALDYNNQALAFDERRKDLLGKAYSLQMLALIRVAEKNFAAALPIAEQTVPMFEKSGDNDGLARSLTLLGNIYLSFGNYEKSLENLQKALSMREASGSRDGLANARIAIARVYLAQGKMTDARGLAQKAAASARENGNREVLWQAQTVTGETFLAENEGGKTREALDAAIGTIESLRGEIVGGASENSLFFAERTKPYQMLAAMLAGENDFNEAFEYAERAKARVLLDAVRFGRTQQTAVLTAEEQRGENRLRGDVSGLNAQISKLSAGNVEKINDLTQKLEAARTALARFQTGLYAQHPELRIKRGAVKPLEISEIGNLLDEQDALLEYMVADDAILLFVFTKSSGAVEFKTYRIGVKREELSNNIGRFRRMLADRNVLFAAESRRLFDLLLRPAAAQLAGKTNLTIVPDDGLWELPFQALQAGENHYVLDDASVSYAPSLTILRELRGGLDDSGPKSLLAFGNPLDKSTKIPNAGFAALPEAEKQTLALKNLYGAGNTRIFNREAADEAALKSETANGFSILHLATHGVLDNNSPLNSYVLLAPNAATNDDGKLEAWEILEMNLKSDLVMLSACETARGQARSGEGLVGLAWSLMVAGARNVAVSQWKVESASTTNLTIEFYKVLKQNGNAKKAEALRQAELKLRRHPLTAHPFYWAGFVLIGEGD